MSERVTQLEAEAEATSEIGGVLEEGSLESQFKALEAGNVDDQLEALKRKMALTAGKSEDPRQLGSGRADAKSAPPPAEELSADDLKAAEIDAQLEELKKKLSG
ncbi:PspA/IM30 family protein [Nannocystis pusilla]|uniref:PspA/IM30 family protein n=1 Tax=Nannocystis pusilla TaxID=889268 RepID=UPI003DA452B3